MSDKKIADMDELEMQACKAPKLNNVDELGGYITQLLEKQHDYGTCVYAMSLAATAAFNLVASKLGVSGFQASAADLDILRRTRGYEHGFMVIDANDLLYPQYDVPGKVRDWIARTRASGQLAKAANNLLETSGGAHANVVAHWRQLAGEDGGDER